MHSNDTNYRPRLTAEITEEQAKLLNTILPHGAKKQLLTIIVDGIIELYNRGGYSAISAFMDQAISIEQTANFGIQAAKSRNVVELEKQLEKLREINYGNY